MPERPNGAVSKTVVSSNGHRGFKSHFLRHSQGGPVTKGRAARRAGAFALVAVAVATLVAPTADASSTSDDAIERRAVLRLGDFPAGWEKTPRRDPTDRGIDVCAGIDAVNDDLLPRSTRSPRFVHPGADDVLVTNAVVVLRSAKQARGYLASYRDPDAARCLELLTEASLTDAGVAAVGVYVTPTGEVPAGADEAAGFGIEITVPVPGTAGGSVGTAVLAQDILIVRVGRALANFGFLNPAKPLPEQGELVDAVIGRLQDALGT